MYLFWVSVLISAVCLDTASSELPDGWKVCRKGPGQIECLKSAIQIAVRSLVPGNESLRLPAIDPMHFGDAGNIVTKGDKSAPIDLVVTLNNLTLYNLGKLEVTDVRIQGRNIRLNYFVAGGIEGTSHYIMKGKLLNVPLNGEGSTRIAFINTDVFYDILFSEAPEVRDGKEYLVVESVANLSDPRDMDVQFENLSTGDEQLDQHVNEFLQKNWRLGWAEMKFSFESALSAGLKAYINQVFSQIPTSDFELF